MEMSRTKSKVAVGWHGCRVNHDSLMPGLTRALQIYSISLGLISSLRVPNSTTLTTAAMLLPHARGHCTTHETFKPDLCRLLRLSDSTAPRLGSTSQ